MTTFTDNQAAELLGLMAQHMEQWSATQPESALTVERMSGESLRFILAAVGEEEASAHDFSAVSPSIDTKEEAARKNGISRGLMDALHMGTPVLTEELKVEFMSKTYPGKVWIMPPDEDGMLDDPKFIELPPCDGLLAHRNGFITMMRAYRASTVERLMEESAEQARSMAVETSRMKYKPLVDAVTQGSQLGLPDFLEWVAARLVKVHGENPHVDYVQTLNGRAGTIRAALAAAGEKP